MKGGGTFTRIVRNPVNIGAFKSHMPRIMCQSLVNTTYVIMSNQIEKLIKRVAKVFNNKNKPKQNKTNNIQKKVQLQLHHSLNNYKKEIIK